MIHIFSHFLNMPSTLLLLFALNMVSDSNLNFFPAKHQLALFSFYSSTIISQSFKLNLLQILCNLKKNLFVSLSFAHLPNFSHFVIYQVTVRRQIGARLRFWCFRISQNFQSEFSIVIESEILPFRYRVKFRVVRDLLRVKNVRYAF